VPDAPVYGKEMVDIASIEPQGTSLLQLGFDDGSTGSYSWKTLHEPGVNHDRSRQAYPQKLKAGPLKPCCTRAWQHTFLTRNRVPSYIARTAKP